MARPIPVLPEVGSMTTEPGPRMPRRSASSVMESAIRSLMLAPGLARSSLTQTSTRGSKSRLIRRCGVSPIVARIVSAFIERSPSDDEIGVLEPVAHATDADLAGLVDDGIGWQARRKEHVPADHAVAADHGVAAEDGRVRIEHGAVLNGRVALRAGCGLRHGERAQRDALVELDVVADHCRLADHDPGAVIDAERPADRGPGMDVDAGPRVGHLGEEPRQDRDA